MRFDCDPLPGQTMPSPALLCLTKHLEIFLPRGVRCDRAVSPGTDSVDRELTANRSGNIILQGSHTTQSMNINQFFIQIGLKRTD